MLHTVLLTIQRTNAGKYLYAYSLMFNSKKIKHINTIKLYLYDLYDVK